MVATLTHRQTFAELMEQVDQLYTDVNQDRCDNPFLPGTGEHEAFVCGFLEPLSDSPGFTDPGLCAAWWDGHDASRGRLGL